MLGIILTLAIGGYSKEEDIKITLLNFNEKEIFINKKKLNLMDKIMYDKVFTDPLYDKYYYNIRVKKLDFNIDKYDYIEVKLKKDNEEKNLKIYLSFPCDNTKIYCSDTYYIVEYNQKYLYVPKLIYTDYFFTKFLN